MRKYFLLAAILAIGAGSAMGASTQSNRDDSLILVGISPVGIHIPTFLTMPLTVGIYLGEDVLIGVEGGKFSYDSSEIDPDADETFNGNFSNFGAYLRWFPNTNSFNLLFAVHKREWDVTFGKDFTRDHPRLPTVLLEATLTAEATVGTVGFGSQWIMDFGLVVAMDWLLLSSNINESHTFQISSNLGSLRFTESELRRFDADIQEGADSLNELSGFPGILVFSLGWAF